MEEQKERIHESGLPKPPSNPLPYNYIHEFTIPTEEVVGSEGSVHDSGLRKPVSTQIPHHYEHEFGPEVEVIESSVPENKEL